MTMTTKTSGALIGEDRPKRKRQKPKPTQQRGQRSHPSQPKPLKLRKR